MLEEHFFQVLQSAQKNVMSMVSVHTLTSTMGPNVCVDLDTWGMDTLAQVRSLNVFKEF